MEEKLVEERDLTAKELWEITVKALNSVTWHYIKDSVKESIKSEVKVKTLAELLSKRDENKNHRLVSLDDIGRQLVGFLDLDTRIYYNLIIGYIRCGFPDEVVSEELKEEIRTFEGRSKIFSNVAFDVYDVVEGKEE